MGDWERTYGAGVDAADIIDGYSSERRREEGDPSPFNFPDGMSSIDVALFHELSEYTRSMEDNAGIPYGDLITDWVLLKIIAIQPDNEASMRALIGFNIDYMHEFLIAVREAKEKHFQEYLKSRERQLKSFARWKDSGDDDNYDIVFGD